MTCITCSVCAYANCTVVLIVVVRADNALVTRVGAELGTMLLFYEVNFNVNDQMNIIF